MASYVFRVWLTPNPALEFEPDQEVWRDIEIEGSNTLEDFHETIFDAFDRWESHAYEFLTHDEDGIATRSYVDPHLYGDNPSWPPMDDTEVDQFIEQAVPNDVSDEVKTRFRDLRTDPPTEANAADTTIEELDPEVLQSLHYTFDFGDNWDHYIELQEIQGGTLEGDPTVVEKQGVAPPQYPNRTG